MTLVTFGKNLDTDPPLEDYGFQYNMGTDLYGGYLYNCADRTYRMHLNALTTANKEGTALTTGEIIIRMSLLLNMLKDHYTDREILNKVEDSLKILRITPSK